MAERVRDRVHQILETHQAPPMEEEKVRELKAIIARADRKYA
ncbi:MAG: hypothetical protein JRH07_12445 [Deltaproteobacteria bacterium]|nr:hypothetical protein [Deltaproteobacteria bacterium]